MNEAWHKLYEAADRHSNLMGTPSEKEAEADLETAEQEVEKAAMTSPTPEAVCATCKGPETSTVGRGLLEGITMHHDDNHDHLFDPREASAPSQSTEAVGTPDEGSAHDIAAILMDCYERNESWYEMALAVLAARPEPPVEGCPEPQPDGMPCVIRHTRDSDINHFSDAALADALDELDRLTEPSVEGALLALLVTPELAAAREKVTRAHRSWRIVALEEEVAGEHSPGRLSELDARAGAAYAWTEYDALVRALQKETM